MNNPTPKLAEGLAGCAVLPPMTEDRPRRNAMPTEAAHDGTPHAAARKPTTTKGKTDRRATRDRFELLNAFVDFTAGRLTRSELLVWLTLYRDTRDGIARTAQADLARRTGASLRSISLAIARLERLGLLVVVQRGGLKRGPSSYRVRPLGKGA